MNEDVLPASKRADSLLPFAARRALGLPTYRDNERRAEYYLDTLVRGARRVHMFFVENSDKERSRFVEKALWEKQKQAGEKRTEKLFRTVRYDVALQAAGPRRWRRAPRSPPSCAASPIRRRPSTATSSARSSSISPTSWA